MRTHVARIRLGCRGALYSLLCEIATEPHKQRSTSGVCVLIGFPFRLTQKNDNLIFLPSLIVFPLLPF